MSTTSFHMGVHKSSCGHVWKCSSFFFMLTVLFHPSYDNVSRWDSNGVKLWKCVNGCGRQYKNKSSYQRHLKYECGVPKKFRCHLCDREFAQKENHKTHLIVKHKLVHNIP